MKICFISPCNLSEESGGKTHTLEFANNWAEMGHDVYLFSRGNLNKNETKKFNYIKVPFFPLKYNIDEFSYSFFLFFILFYFCLKIRFDIFYQRASILDIHFLFLKNFKVPIILEVNDLPFSEYIEKEVQNDTVNIFKKVIWRLVLPISDKLENISYENSRKILLTALRVKKMKKYNRIENKVKIIPFGANTIFFKPLSMNKCRNDLNLSSDGLILCFVGSFLPWQGLLEIISSIPKVISEYPNFYFLVVGDEPKYHSVNLKEMLLKRIDELNISDNIIFTGHIPYKDVNFYINASDFCIIAQKPNRDGFSPLKLFEYMACKKPVIGSDVEGVKEIIEDCECGLVFKAENTESMAKMMILMIKNENLRTEMGNNGFKCVKNKYNWRNVALEALNIN